MRRQEIFCSRELIAAPFALLVSESELLNGVTLRQPMTCRCSGAIRPESARRKPKQLTVGTKVVEKRRTTMKLKAISLFLGLCLAILAVAASPAYGATRATTAFNSFHVQSATPLSQPPYTEDPYL